jgi:hypothetical protein
VDYKPAYGRFVRGMDPTGEVDPDKIRLPGTTRSDAIVSHTHQIGVTGGDGKEMVPGGATQSLAGFVQDTWGGGPAKHPDSNSGGSTETRPKNVALLYCVLN